jgi:hypothetical protein
MGQTTRTRILITVIALVSLLMASAAVAVNRRSFSPRRSFQSDPTPIAIKDITGADLENGVLYVKDAKGGEHAYKCVGGEWKMVNDVWGCVGGHVVEI